MATTTLSGLCLRPTPLERARGRFMRAPDHGEGEGGDAEAGDGDGSGADESGKGDAGEGGDAGSGADDKGDADKSSEGEGADKSLINGGGTDEKVDEPDPATLPPEAYELTAPEGFEINAEILAEADPIFRDLGLTNDQANKLMPLAGKFAERLQAASNDAFQAMATDWAKQAKADPVLGGKNWTETETLVAKALDTAAARLPDITVTREGKKVTLTGADQVAEFRTLLDETKLGNHPTLMRMFRFYGSSVSEDGILPRGDSSAPVNLPREQVLYGAKEGN